MDLKLPPELNVSGNLEVNWKTWYQRFTNYMLATEKSSKNNEAKIAILLTLIGDDGVNIYNTFKKVSISNDKGEADYDKVIQMFTQHCTGKKNIVYERYCFLMHKRKEEQTIDNFVTELKLKAMSCEYGDLEESIIRDQLVLNVGDQGLQERLIGIPDLELTKAVLLIKQVENTKEQVRQINSENKLDIDAIQYRNKQRNFSNNKTKWSKPSWQVKTNDNQVSRSGTSLPYSCKKCGTKHEPFKCPAFGLTCRICGRKNHFAVGCFGRTKYQKVQTVGQSGDTETDEESGTEHLLGINEVSKVRVVDAVDEQSWKEAISINGRDVEFKLDTGSQVNLIPLYIFKNLGQHLNLNKTNVVLEAYGGFRMKPLGKIKLNCLVRGEMLNAEFLIVNKKVSPILGLRSCNGFGLIKRVNISEIKSVNHEDVDRDKFVKEHKIIFEGIGTFPSEYKIKMLDNAVGVINPPRRVPQTILERLEIELLKLEKNGIVEKVKEPKEWCSNLVIVQKPDKSLRLCLDPKELNKFIKRDYLLIPTFSDIRSKLKNKRFFTVLDVKKGFWHIKLDKKSTDLCTFSTPLGYYKFLRLPFGLSCAPEAFIRQSRECFSGINNIINYFDDYCIATETKEEHDVVLNQVVDRAKNLNIKFNLDKLQYCKKSVKFMGHVISELGLQPDPDQVKAILELKEPRNKIELQRIIGMINYLRDFIPKMAERTSPLRELLKNNVLWEWNERHRLAFQELKQIIINPPVLAHFDDQKDIVLQCDASKDGVGCCLLQEKKPIAFASRALTETEIRYAQIEKEFLSIIFACRKFNYFIYGRPITVLTDHKPLVAIMSKDINKIPSNRLQKMRIKLLDYSITLKYLQGKYMHIADLLSRNFIDEDSSIKEYDTVGTVHFINRYDENNTICDLKKATEQDPVLKKIIEYYKNGWPTVDKISEDTRLYFNQRNEIIVEEGIVYMQHKIIIPYKARKIILKLLHESHMGITKTKNRAKNLYYWPGMLNEIEQFIISCKTCELYRSSNRKNKLINHEVPKLPFEKVATDILSYGNTDYLVLIDYYSKWIELKKIKNKTAPYISKKLKSIFSRYGIPKILMADNMPFDSYEFKNFAKLWNFKIVTSSPEYAQSNGLAEKAVHIAKQILRKCLKDQKEVEIALLEYRSTPVGSLGVTPSELMMSRLLRTKLPVAEINLKPKVQDIRDRQIKTQAGYKAWYDKRANRKEIELIKGQAVMIKRKWGWVPGVVVKKADTPRSYLIKQENGRIIRRNLYHLRPSRNKVVKKSYNTTYWDDLINNVAEGTCESQNTENGESQEVGEQVNQSENSVNQQIQTRSGRCVRPPKRYSP